MPAYMIAVRNRTIDPAALGLYKRDSAATRPEDFKVLAQGVGEAVEGPAVESAVLVEFSSLQSARAWYDSPAYAEIRPHRQTGADYQMVFVDEVAAQGDQPKPGAYILVLRDRVDDPGEMATYHDIYRQERAGMPEHRMIARGGQPAGPCEMVEGTPLEAAMVVAFQSVEGARAWYDSPGYTRARRHRMKAGAFRFILLEAR